MLKICDFGLIQLLDENSNNAYILETMGTHGYLAPETKPKSNITTAVDIWGLGVV